MTREPGEVDRAGTEVIQAFGDLRRSSRRDDPELMKYFNGAAWIIDFHKENPMYRDPVRGWENQPPTSVLEFREQWRETVAGFVTRFGGSPENFDPVLVLRSYVEEIRRVARE